jgi:hypothetical protein
MLSMRTATRYLLALLAIGSMHAVASAAEDVPLAGTNELQEFLVLPAVGNYGRLPMHQDAVEQAIVLGQWKSPSEGDLVDAPGGQKKAWKSAVANVGSPDNPQRAILDTRTIRGGYAFAKFESPVEQVMLLDATGHAAVYVNGELRTGDPYGAGWLRLPVKLKQGENTFLFHIAGDQLAASLTLPSEKVFVMEDDAILPTLVRGEVEPQWAAVNVVNASDEWLRDAELFCSVAQGGKTTTAVPPIPPLSVRKVAFQVPPAATDQPEKAEMLLEVIAGKDQQILSTVTLEVSQVGADGPHLRTFRSLIDGSVQPYAVLPAAKKDGASNESLPSMIVTLHDAGITCTEQLERFRPKSWAHVVAPLGRRPYGFDWEDWARIDVLEALNDARRRYPHEPGRTYLTGRGMGGHGTWHLGVTHPDEFAAIGPNDGWASFWSYGGGMPAFEKPTGVEALIQRSYAPSDTTEALTNLSDVGVYVLHGSDDETVPVTQARFMRNRLAGFHTNFAYYENPQSNALELDENCDWAPMTEFFERLRRPSALERTTVDFMTSDPGVANQSDWLIIEAQQQPLKPSRALVRQDVEGRQFVGKTENVARLAIDVEHLPPWQPISVTLDGQELALNAWPVDYKLYFERKGDAWKPVEPPAPAGKSPVRNGGFKSVFDRNPILVYGTMGTKEENAWAEAKARYDAETFWYRGGGDLEVIPDSSFKDTDTNGRNVILYGNADTNSMWRELLTDSPIRVNRGRVTAGDRTLKGEHLAVLMVRPRPDEDEAVVGVVAGSGREGAAITNRLRYFVSGINYPDFLLVGADGLSRGIDGIRAWGYFGPDWSIDSGDFAWRESGSK